LFIDRKYRNTAQKYGHLMIYNQPSRADSL
jgi:hypothetical protein